MYRTKDQVASEFIAEGKRRGITERGIVICIATGLVESNLTVYANSKVPESLSLPHDAVGSDGKSVGPLQQQVVWGNGGWWWGDAATCMDPTRSAGLFYDRLVKKPYQSATSDVAAGAIAQSIQGSAFPDRYATRMAEAQKYYNRLSQGAAVPDSNRPDFNEFPLWSPSSQSRSGTKVDLFLLHTQEGGGGNSAAEDLAKYLGNPANQVSYHYTISQASDGGVTVVDVVDTDKASWSVLSANNRSINLCFAGSRASWTRDQWMKQSKAIDVAAYLAVQDCKKYGIPFKVIGTGGTYSADRAGVADHQYVTKVLGDGTHTDVGSGFPVDYFSQRFAFWAAGGATTSTPPAAKVWPKDYSDRELLEWIVAQLGDGDPAWPSKGMTLRDKVWSLGKAQS